MLRKIAMVAALICATAGCEMFRDGGGTDNGDDGISLPPLLPWWKTENFEFVGVAPTPMRWGGNWE